MSLVRPEPICSPIGVIAMSAPRLNRAIPRIRKTAEIKNTVISKLEKLIIGVRLRIKTIATIGNTDSSDSLSFLSNSQPPSIKCILYLL